MRLSNGEIVYTDPTKWDTDGDGLSDGEEIYLHSYQILSGRFNDDGTYTENLTFGYQFFMKSDPTVMDSDNDGYNDHIDFDPLYYDAINGIIYQSKHKMGIGYDQKSIADDLKTNDFSYEKLKDINKLFEYQLNLTEPSLETDFKFMCNTLFAHGNYDMVNDLINVFMSGTNNTISIKTNEGVKDISCYTNYSLVEQVYNDKQVQDYINFTKEEFVKQIQKFNGDLISAKRNMQKVISDIKVSDIAFSRDDWGYLFGGLTISINDLWGSNVCINDYHCDGKRFYGTLHFTLYDHFGLDQPDVEKIYVNLAGFRAWFVLQHYKKFNGKYKPFINLMEYNISFQGEL